MSASPISQEVLSLLKKMSKLTAEEVCEVEHFIEFLLTKKGSTLHHADMTLDNTEDASYTDTISEFIASFTASPMPQPSISQNSSDSSHQVSTIDSNHVIIAPEEQVLEDYPTNIDFADINARFSKKREELHGKRSKRSNLEDLDWL
jgi:hypothetical protein